jgi:hypothetical protein
MILFHQTKQFLKLADPKPDLALGIGEFFVTHSGVEAMFLPPLQRLSSFYTWRELPFAFGAAHALVKGEDGSVLGRLSQRIGLSLIEMDMLNLEMIEQPPAAPVCISSIEADADRLKEWSYSLAERCPIGEISDALRRLAAMDAREVDRYVETFLQ